MAEDLITTIQRIISNYIKSQGLTDLAMGTVTSVNPLQVSLVNTMLPLPQEALLLTESVVEKKLVLNRTDFENLVCYEHGTALPKEESNTVILNRGLLVNDKVLMLRVQNGQMFIILSRVFS